MKYEIIVITSVIITNLIVSITILAKLRRLNASAGIDKAQILKPLKLHFSHLKKRDKPPLEERQRRTVLQNIERYNGTAEGQEKIPKE